MPFDLFALHIIWCHVPWISICSTHSRSDDSLSARWLISDVQHKISSPAATDCTLWSELMMTNLLRRHEVKFFIKAGQWSVASDFLRLRSIKLIHCDAFLCTRSVLQSSSLFYHQVSFPQISTRWFLCASFLPSFPQFLPILTKPKTQEEKIKNGLFIRSNDSIAN